MPSYPVYLPSAEKHSTRLGSCYGHWASSGHNASACLFLVNRYLLVAGSEQKSLSYSHSRPDRNLVDGTFIPEEKGRLFDVAEALSEQNYLPGPEFLSIVRTWRPR